MVAFQSARRAVDCAVELQRAMVTRSATAAEPIQIFRAGALPDTLALVVMVMRYFPKRARKKQDISLLLKVCPT